MNDELVKYLLKGLLSVFNILHSNSITVLHINKYTKTYLSIIFIEFRYKYLNYCLKMQNCK